METAVSSKSNKISLKTKSKHWARRISKKLVQNSSDMTCKASPKLRRSSRTRYPRLRFWCGERLQYRLTSSGGVECLGIEQESTPLVASHINLNETIETFNLASGVPVLDCHDGLEIKADVIKPFQSLTWISYSDGSYKIAYAYPLSSGAYGFLLLPEFEKKPLHCLEHFDVLFVVLCGTIHLTIQETMISLTVLDSFVVPQGSAYSIENKLGSEALLSFAITNKSLVGKLKKN